MYSNTRVASCSFVKLPNSNLMVIFRMLHRAFRAHYEEIENFIMDYLERVELDEELEEFGKAYVNYIKFDRSLLIHLPDPTKSTIFKILKQGVSLDP